MLLVQLGKRFNYAFAVVPILPLYVVVRTLRTRFSAKIFERVRMRIAFLHIRLHT